MSEPSLEQPLGYSRDGDVVTLRMTVDDWNSLLLALGGMAGSAAREGLALSGWLAFANRLNVGNPTWTPYAVPEHADQT
jgi:hypothetical protein